jgi:predicted nucleic acid-binding Zn ribbon protein
MPVYVYRIVRPGASPDEAEQTFEIRQSIHDQPLTHHPETGEPVERVLCPPNIASGKMGNAALSSAGFTKYKRMSDGTYERQAGGGGPKHVDPQKFKGMLGE